MNQSSRGFTFIEILIVLMVGFIVITIGVVSWNGAAVSVRDKARETDMSMWVSTFENYKGRFVVYPVMPTGDGTAGAATVCLGSFTAYSNKCGQYTSSTATRFIAGSSSTTLLSEVAKIGNVPKNGELPIRNALIGPIVYVTKTTAATTSVNAQFINFFEGNCPRGTTNITASLPSTIAGVLTGQPTTIKACSITKTFTY